jgi:Zn-dependent peptidase ImmA (M78 family)
MKKDSVNVFEAEANRFARYLLVPTKFLKAEVKKLKCSHLDDKSIKLLAKKFQVEDGLMMVRLMEVGLIKL